MQIVLLVLGIIGRIILWILLAILAILIIVLVTPFRYDLEVEVHGKDIRAGGKVHFWFQAFALKIEFAQKKLTGYIRMLFIKKYIIGGKDDKSENDEKALDKSTEDEIKASDALEPVTSDAQEVPDVIEESSEKSDTEENYSVSPEGEEQTEAKENPEETTAEEATTEETTTEETASEEKKKVDIDDKLGAIIDKIKGTFDKLVNKYETTKKKLQSLKGFLDLKCTKGFIKALIRMLKRMLKSILPKKIKGNLTLGLMDPQKMGMVCMWAGIFYPKYKKTFDFEPVFGESQVDGHVVIKGRIILGALLWYLLCILFVPDTYRTIKAFIKMKKHGGKHGEE